MGDSPFSLDGRHILVTGASSGIGRAIAIESAKMGARITAFGRSESHLLDTMNALSGEGHEFKILDLSNTDDIADVVLTLDRVDGVVHCAGITKMAPVPFITAQDFHDVMDVNVMAPIELTKWLLKKKKINKNGSLVFISSVVSGLHPYKGQGGYAASKGALNAYAKVLALELVTKQIRVNSILPAMVQTKFLESMGIDSNSLASDEASYPLGYGVPEDVAWAAIYLLSEASRWMTGNQLIIDGGVSLT